MDNFGFYKYDNVWVLASEVKVAGGPHIAVEPVRVVGIEDKAGLRAALLDLIGEEPPVIPEPDYDSEEWKRSVYDKTVKASSWREFAKHAQCFNLRVVGDSFVIEQWKRQGVGFYPPPIWTRCFPGTQLDKLVDALMAKVVSGDSSGGQ